jgi:hypothetical protein
LTQLECHKCASHKVKVVMFETEGKKFAVCDECGNVQTIGRDLQDRYGKWKSHRDRADR